MPQVLHFPHTARLSIDQFFDLCRANPDWKLELTATGDLELMPPTGGETGNRNATLLIRVGVWNEQTNLGYVFDSSTGFNLPNGANRSPDVAWVRRDRWEALTSPQQEKFPPLAPNFVIELMSPSDDRPTLQAKMREYIENGVELGWLFDRSARQVEVYQAGRSPQILDAPAQLTGDAVLPGFTLNLQNFWL